MPVVVLVLDLCFIAAAFGIRTAVQWKRTGDTGWRLGRPHSRAELVARISLLTAAGLLVAALVAANGQRGSDLSSAVFVVGVAIAVTAVVIVLVAQLHMGESWRIGVDPAERTTLVRTGLYSHVRNPIYSGMLLFAIGQALMLPGPWTIAACVAMFIGVEVQVRLVEEPYLHATHGQHYRGWAARAGRFVPAVGRG